MRKYGYENQAISSIHRRYKGGRQVAHAYLVDSVLRKYRLGFFVANGGVNDYIVALLPINGGSDTVLVSELQGVYNPDNFVLQPQVVILRRKRGVI